MTSSQIQMKLEACFAEVGFRSGLVQKLLIDGPLSTIAVHSCLLTSLKSHHATVALIESKFLFIL